ncbi:MFS transporter [Salininema proteolyticum]|uniref:MFS transporter n=1 Tax=Salininema proteolyticum TaxID=1607685 RepID=A0ABV8TXB5_9ACTN
MRSDRKGSTALAMAIFFAVTVEMAPAGAVGHIARDLHADVPAAAGGSAAYAIATAVVAVPCALLTRRMNLRRTVIATGVLFALAALATATAPNLETYLALRAVNGAVHGAFFPVVLALAAATDPDRPGRAVARVLLGNACALAVGVPLSEALSGWGWQVPIGLAAAAVAVAALAAPKGADVSTAEPPALRALPWIAVAVPALVFTMALAGHFSFYTYLSPLATQQGAVPSIILGAYGVAVIGGTMASGALANGRRTSRAALIAGTQGLVLAAVALVQGVPAVAVGAVVAGVCFGLLPTIVQTEMLTRARGAETVASALAVVAFNVGIAGGAFGGGLAYPAGSTAPALVGGILLGLAALAFAFTGFSRTRADRGVSPSNQSVGTGRLTRGASTPTWAERVPASKGRKA